MAFIEVDEPAMLDSTGQEIVDKLDAIKNAISPSASTNISNYLTIASGLTVLRKKAYKYGNVVIIDLNIQGTLNDGSLIATMDSQFRPADGDLRSLGTMANTSTGSLINNACLWFFASNGQLEYYGTARTGTTTMHLVYMI